MKPIGMFRAMLPVMSKMAPPLMLMGFMVLIAGLVLGVYGADLVSGGVAGDRGDMRDAQVLAAWLPSLEFLGMGLILFAISVTLLAIATALRTMGGNIVGLILKHEQ